MPPFAYLFDFDGTLADSMPVWAEKMLRILKITKTPYPADVIRRITPLGDLGTARYFQEKLGVPWGIERMLEEMNAYALPKYRDEIPLKPGVVSYLEALRARHCSLNILTASPHRMLDPCLQRNGIAHFFAHIWSCDDFGLTKSQPQIYLEAVSRMGAMSARTAFFDDNPGAIQAAARAGLYTVGVYDPTGEEFMDAMKRAARQYILSFEGMIPICEEEM